MDFAQLIAKHIFVNRSFQFESPLHLLYDFVSWFKPSLQAFRAETMVDGLPRANRLRSRTSVACAPTTLSAATLPETMSARTLLAFCGS